MKFLLTLLLLLAFCFVAYQVNNDVTSVVQEEKKLEPRTPNSDWIPIFFEEINGRAKIARLRDLRLALLPNDDLELRVWIGFGLIPLEGFVIKRSSGQWSGVHIRSISPRLARRDYQRPLPSPKSGWESFWKRLTDEGALTLPDSSQLKDEVITVDGESFVVEINMNKAYRTYRYSNPHLQKWPEAKKMIRIAEIIIDEFNIERRLLAQE